LCPLAASTTARVSAQTWGGDRFIWVKESESVLFRLHAAQLFDLAAPMFALQPSFVGGQRGLGPFADLGPLGCLADQAHQTGNSVLAVLLLSAEPSGIDDQITLFAHALPAQTGKAVSNLFRKGTGMGHIEAELHGRTHLIDILTSRAGGANELFMNFFLIDSDRAGNSNHAFSVRRVGFPGKRRRF